MDPLALISIALMAVALLVVGVALGATVLWRLDHLPTLPPPLPAWVAVSWGAGVFAWSAALFVAGQWPTAAGTLALTAIVGLASLRGRFANGRSAGD